MLEDDEDDQFITRSYFEEHGHDVGLTFVSNTSEFFAALDRIKMEGLTMPSVVLLSYHSFPLGANEVLTRLKADIAWHAIPVIVLSTALPPHLVKECYASGAASVIIKPRTSEGVRKKIGAFFQYWFETAALG